MSEKRLNENVCIMMHRKSCAYGQAEFAEPKSPTVKCSAHRSIREAMTPQYVLMVRAQKCFLRRVSRTKGERRRTGTYSALDTSHVGKHGIAYRTRVLWRRNPHSREE